MIFFSQTVFCDEVVDGSDHRVFAKSFFKPRGSMVQLKRIFLQIGIRKSFIKPSFHDVFTLLITDPIRHVSFHRWLFNCDRCIEIHSYKVWEGTGHQSLILWVDSDLHPTFDSSNLERLYCSVLSRQNLNTPNSERY